MTNFEKYKDELIRIAITNALAVRADSGEPCCCNEEIRCEDCIFPLPVCSPEARSKWLDEEYKEPVEPEVDWSKVAVDTPVLVRDSESEKWRKRYFAAYKGHVFTYTHGRTSWSANEEVQYWRFAKLADAEVGE